MEDDLQDDAESLQDAIRTAVDEWHVRNGGMAVALVAVVDRIDSDGVPILSVTQLHEQPTHRSMGLVAYMTEWYRDDANNEMLVAAYGAAEDDD